MKVLQGQSLFDIAIQTAGSVEAAFDLAFLNGISVTDDIPAGFQLELPPIVNKSIADYYVNKGIKPATALELSQVPQVLEGVGYWAIDIDFVVN